MTTFSLLTKSNTLTLFSSTIVTLAKLRAERTAFSLSLSITTNTLVSTSKLVHTFWNSFVFGVSNANSSTTTKFSLATLSDNAERNAKRRTLRGNL